MGAVVPAPGLVAALAFLALVGLLLPAARAARVAPAVLLRAQG